VRYLLDTNAVLRWLGEPRKLSRDQIRVIEAADKGLQQVAISAVTLLEIAAMDGTSRIRSGAAEILQLLEYHPMYRLLPVTFEIAIEAAALKALRDPADRAIVATARLHRLKLVTSDEAVIGSKLVSVVE
jgi:PIN domain nuclease of toxin-antitoxin system